MEQPDGQSRASPGSYARRTDSQRFWHAITLPGNTGSAPRPCRCQVFNWIDFFDWMDSRTFQELSAPELALPLA
jgi:hypothetical protein